MWFLRILDRKDGDKSCELDIIKSDFIPRQGDKLYLNCISGYCVVLDVKIRFDCKTATIKTNV